MPKETPEEIEEIMRSNQGVGSGKDEAPFVDDVYNALKEHEDWQEGYDY